MERDMLLGKKSSGAENLLKMNWRDGVVFVAAFGAAAALAAGPAHAQARVGEAAFVKNEVVRVAGSATSQINVGDGVLRDETVRTGLDSAARLVMADSTNLSLGPGATVKLDRTVFADEHSYREIAIRLTSGAFRFVTGHSEKAAYKITTAVATVGVRGTILDIQSTRGKTIVVLQEGASRVCAIGGQCSELTKPGESAVVTSISGKATIQKTSSPPWSFASTCGAAAGLCGVTRFADATPAVTPPVAAALAYAAPSYKAPAVAAYDWRGTYVGGNAGYGWGRWSSADPLAGDPSVKGWVGGLQAGHNWQFDRWVLGLEGDIQATGGRSSGGSTIVGPTTTPVNLGPSNSGVVSTFQETETFANSSTSSWFSTLRGRAGIAAADAWLFYATGGLAVGEVRSSGSTGASITVTRTVGQAAPTSTTATAQTFQSTDAIKVGWTIGAGIEHAIAPHWTVRTEYLFVDLGTTTLVGGAGRLSDFGVTKHIARMGINYKFGN
jgi:opacity protein-like surface antigen